MTEVEQDGWVYSTGVAYVCSAFVAGLYKAGGILSESTNATEMAPKDVYTLNVYDLDYERPEACVVADPDLPYCQLLGNYRMTLP